MKTKKIVGCDFYERHYCNLLNPPEQQTTLDGMNLSFKLGIAYEKASQGQNVTEFNALVDEYNAWILQHIGEDAGLLKSKLNETPSVITRSAADGTQSLVQPFNASSELSQFGKTEAYVATGISTSQSEEYAIEQKAENL